MPDALVAVPATGAIVGPLEARHLGSPPYRNAADTSRITSTHWHIAWANGLGWGFDGMDGAILALVAPMLIKEFAIDLGTLGGRRPRTAASTSAGPCSARPASGPVAG